MYLVRPYMTGVCGGSSPTDKYQVRVRVGGEGNVGDEWGGDGRAWQTLLATL